MIQQIAKNVFAIHPKYFGSIIYIIKENENIILIDTSSKENENQIKQSLKKLNLSPESITHLILTHAHYDHIENISLFKNAKIYANFTKSINKDHSRSEIKIKSNKYKKITKAKLIESHIPSLKIISTPGHTQEDIVILYKNILFSGDVIFHNGFIGRNDFPESNIKKQKESLEKIKKLNYQILCPGH